MIMHQETLDYEKQFKYEFGQYGQGHNDDTNTKNTPAPHAIGCIYLRPLASKQGGHELLDLATGVGIRELAGRPLVSYPQRIKLTTIQSVGSYGHTSLRLVQQSEPLWLLMQLELG